MNRKRKRIADLGGSGPGRKKAKKAAVDLEGGKRTKFKTFHEQMSEMTVPRIHLGFDNHSAPVVTEDADVDLATSNFGTVLLKWRDLNLSENFGAITRRASRAGANLKQVVHNRDEIANILSDATNVGDGKEAGKTDCSSGSGHLHLEPVVELWCALAKDLQQDFAPYFDRFADAVVSDLTFKVPELIKAAFLALNEVLRILQRRGGPERALEMFSKVMESTLASPRMPPHSLALVAEAASNVVRRARDKEEFFERLLRSAERDA